MKRSGRRSAPILGYLFLIVLAIALQSCAASRPKGCGCGFEERMGRH